MDFSRNTKWRGKSDRFTELGGCPQIHLILLLSQDPVASVSLCLFLGLDFLVCQIKTLEGAVSKFLPALRFWNSKPQARPCPLGLQASWETGHVSQGVRAGQGRQRRRRRQSQEGGVCVSGEGTEAAAQVDSSGNSEEPVWVEWKAGPGRQIRRERCTRPVSSKALQVGLSSCGCILWTSVFHTCRRLLGIICGHS